MGLPLLKVLLAVLSGVMLTASFPPGRLSFLSWIALVPLLKGLEGGPPFQGFKLGLIAGLVHFLTLMYWIVVVLGHYGKLNIFVSLGPLLLLTLYLALYIAIFSSLTAGLMGSRFCIIFIAGFWVSLEYIRSNLLTGMPWCLLGYTQYKQLHLIQIADLCGVYGPSFLIVLINGLIYHMVFRRPWKAIGLLKWEVLIVAILSAGTLAYGHYRLSERKEGKDAGRMLNAAIIQASIDQSIKWDPAYQITTITTYQRLTREAYGFRPDLIVWPETALPFFFQDNLRFSPQVLSMAKESGAIMIFGSPAYEQIRGVTRYYNRAYLLTPDPQKPPQYYDKVHLVPFGEYVPLKKLLSFVSRLVPAAGDFEPGDKVAPLKAGGLSMGILICFEAIFPELARDLTREGANLFINLTNDAWFGMTSAPYQHLSMAVFRSVENRRPMIRAANTGFSAFIGPQGKIQKLSSLFHEEVLEAAIKISGRSLTCYSRLGDLFAIFLLVISFFKFCSYIRVTWMSKRKGPGCHLK
jgi:apolipoprotein N-acyltransferase